MSVALFLITHEGIASSLVTIGEAIIQKPGSNLAYIEVPMDTPTTEIAAEIEDQLKRLDIGNGIVFFTDLYGSTPSNIARQMATKYDTQFISGINLPMILRLLNYRDCDKEELLQKALEGAHQGIQQND